MCVRKLLSRLLQQILLLDLTTGSNYFMLTVLSPCVTVSASHSVSLSTCAKGAATKTTQYFLILPRMLIA